MKQLPFTPLTDTAAAIVLLSAGCTLEVVYGFICCGDRTVMSEEQAAVMLLKNRCGLDAVHEFLRRRR